MKLDIRSIGDVLEQPGTLTSRTSIQRAATVTLQGNITHIVINNTHAPKKNANSTTVRSIHVGRSRPLLYTNNPIPVLNPKRTERIRIEQEMAKVWTKELLTYPGMTVPPKRASATSVIRKFSKTSIASNFSKLLGSHASAHRPNTEDRLRRKSAPGFFEGQKDLDGCLGPADKEVAT